MKKIVYGISTQYQKIGQGEPILFLHGWGCDWQIWSPVIGELSKTHQLFLLDLPAFGESENPPLTWKSTDYLTWLADFCQQEHLTKFILVGHSFGGKISALFAESFPQLLHKLILVDAAGLPAPLSTIKKAQVQLLNLIPESLKSAVPNKLKMKLLAVTHSATDHFNSSPAQRQILKNTIREHIAAKLKKISTPTLLIWGENDDATPLSQAREFAHQIADSKLVIIPGAGHFVFVDKTQDFINQILKFIS